MNKFFFTTAIICIFSAFTTASAMCVSNSSGGVFCYDPLPPIDTTLPPLTWFTVYGGPTLPGQNIGIVDRIDHDLVILGSSNLPESSVREVSASEIQVYAQLASLKEMEVSIQKKCIKTNVKTKMCNTASVRNIHLDHSTKSLSEGVFELMVKRMNRAQAMKYISEAKNSVILYKRIFIASVE